MANINIEKDSKLIKVLASQASNKPVKYEDARQAAEIITELSKDPTPENRHQIAQAIGYTVQELQSHDLDFLSLFGDSSYSVINTLLRSGQEPWKIITSCWPSRILVMFIQVWMWFGNTMIMLMSGIQGINESLFEAAEIDGANSTQTFWRITFPLLKTIMVYTLLTSMIGGLQMFDIPYMLHTGNVVNDYIKTVAVFIYEMFHGNFAKPSFGYSGAASVILFVITSILGALVFYVQRDKDAIEKKKKQKQAAKEWKRKQKGGGFSI